MTLNPTLLRVLIGDAKREGDWAGPSFHSFTDSASLCTGPVKPRMVHSEAQQIPSPHFAVTVAWVFPIQLRSSALLAASGSFQKGRCSGLSHSGSSAGPAQGWTHRHLKPLVHNNVGFSCGSFIAVPGGTHLPGTSAGPTEVFSALPSPEVCKISGPQEDRPSPRLPAACPSRPWSGHPTHAAGPRASLLDGSSWVIRPSVCSRVESTWAMLILPGSAPGFLPREASGQRSLAGYSP